MTQPERRGPRQRPVTGELAAEANERRLVAFAGAEPGQGRAAHRRAPDRRGVADFGAAAFIGRLCRSCCCSPWAGRRPAGARHLGLASSLIVAGLPPGGDRLARASGVLRCAVCTGCARRGRACRATSRCRAAPTSAREIAAEQASELRRRWIVAIDIVSGLDDCPSRRMCSFPDRGKAVTAAAAAARVSVPVDVPGQLCRCRGGFAPSRPTWLRGSDKPPRAVTIWSPAADVAGAVRAPAKRRDRRRPRLGRAGGLDGWREFPEDGPASRGRVSRRPAAHAERCSPNRQRPARNGHARLPAAGRDGAELRRDVREPVGGRRPTVRIGAAGRRDRAGRTAGPSRHRPGRLGDGALPLTLRLTARPDGTRTRTGCARPLGPRRSRWTASGHVRAAGSRAGRPPRGGPVPVAHDRRRATFRTRSAPTSSTPSSAAA